MVSTMMTPSSPTMRAELAAPNPTATYTFSATLTTCLVNSRPRISSLSAIRVRVSAPPAGAKMATHSASSGYAISFWRGFTRGRDAWGPRLTHGMNQVVAPWQKCVHHA
jgi:hypothetical protein